MFKIYCRGGTTMRESIVGAVAGALITGLFSLLIFYLGNFSTQETIEHNIVEALSIRFDSIDKDMLYDQALETIYREHENAIKKIADLQKQIDEYNIKVSELNNQINDKQLIIDNQNSQEEIDTIIQAATEYWNNSDYVQALTLLKNSKSKSVDVEILYNQYADEYQNLLLIQAESLIAERKREEAINILKEGSLLIADNGEINNKIDEINNKPSALLCNLVPISGTDSDEQYDIWDISSQDNYGNKYSSGICLRQKYNEKVHLVYALNGKYTILTGYFVLSESGKNTDGNYVLYAYTLVNGEPKLLWESTPLSTATRPIPVEINVSDVMDLVIEVYDPNKTGSNAWTAFVDAKLE